MAGSGFIKRGGDHFALHGALHFRHFFRTFVNQQNDQNAFGVVRRDGVRDVLHQHCLSGLRRGDDQTALALADRSNDVDQTARQVLVALHVAFELQGLVREERRQVLEQHPVLQVFRRLAVHRFHLDEREIAFAVLRNADFTFHGVAGMEIESADLGGR